MTMYDNQSLTSNNVSFWNRTAVGAFVDGVDVQLDPNGAEGLTRIQARSFAKCTATGELTGTGATRNDIALQFALEGGSSNILMCLEY